MERITYHADRPLTGRIARPDTADTRPAVLVMHSALGLDDQVVRRARDLAALGFVALVTDMYGLDPETATSEDCGREFMALQERPDLLRERVRSAFECIRTAAGVDAARVSAIGFCFGGQCVLELARSGAPARAVVSFHGLLKTAAPAPAGTLTARVLAITGARDPYAPLTDLEAFQQEMTAAGANWQTTLYGEGLHAFTAPEIARHEVPGTAYDPVLDRLSWAQAVAFLQAANED